MFRWGETLPPQNQFRYNPNFNHAPWIDEVQQSVAVIQGLNQNANFFVHQSGAYKLDAPSTDTPFFSPPLAKFCSGNSCYFASW